MNNSTLYLFIYKFNDFLWVFCRRFQASPSWWSWNWINLNGCTSWLESSVPSSTEPCSLHSLSSSPKSLLYVWLVYVFTAVILFLDGHYYYFFSFLGFWRDRSGPHKEEMWHVCFAVCWHWSPFFFHIVFTGLFCLGTVSKISSCRENLHVRCCYGDKLLCKAHTWDVKCTLRSDKKVQVIWLISKLMAVIQ